MHLTSNFCITLLNPYTKVTGLLNFWKLWLWLHVRCKKPCVLVAMTVSPLTRLF